jgi:hypothetical protein
MIFNRCNYIERQAKTEMREKTFKCLILEEEEWGGTELHTSCYKLNDRNSTAWFRLGMWKLKGLRQGAERGNVLYVKRKGLHHTHF